MDVLSDANIVELHHRDKLGDALCHDSAAGRVLQRSKHIHNNELKHTKISVLQEF